jgi:hypothetical protein
MPKYIIKLPPWLIRRIKAIIKSKQLGEHIEGDSWDEKIGDWLFRLLENRTEQDLVYLKETDELTEEQLDKLLRV